jgi:hypothetical protein
MDQFDEENKKQIAGNYSSPATEDTGIQPEKFNDQ